MLTRKELYIFVAGRGGVRRGDPITVAEEGQCIIFRPGEPHQVLNTSENDLGYFVIADHSRADVISYPETVNGALNHNERFLP
ncbi:MAG: cupin domain-containing protein [Verrucomicrobia bacterium]|nr:cupin domain-containing protein [Verrucomicrobiota bacterium]